MQQIGNEVIEYVKSRSASEDYRRFYSDVLCRMIEIDNTPTQGLDRIRENEHKVLQLLEQQCRQIIGQNCRIEYSPISLSIADHPYYTKPFYTMDEAHPDGLAVEEIYRDRHNLLVLVPSPENVLPGKGVIYNAHVDTVAPYVPCKVEDGVIYGRGACDDKGQVALLLSHMKLLKEVEEKFGLSVPGQRAYQFVIEEEMGGNGSLSLALDERFRGFEAVVVEATSNVPHPGNRGAMWFRLTLSAPEPLNVCDLMGFVVAELAHEGRRIREESNQPLFPREFVQVNFGVLGPFGRHPSAVNDYVAFELTIRATADRNKVTDRLGAVIQSALHRYLSFYQDCTKQIDQQTGKAMLERHYALTPIGRDGAKYKLEVFGVGGHMSAMLRLDNAVIKAGYILEALYRAANLSGWRVSTQLPDCPDSTRKLTLQGGIGFTPAHRMADLRERLRQAARRGVQQYGQCFNVSIGDDVFDMNFDMLHNEAYCSPSDCPSMRAFAWAFRQLELPWPRPAAFKASCDARIYANAGHNTVTFGPGRLEDAHSDTEKIDVNQAQQALALLTLVSLALDTARPQDALLEPAQ